MEVIQKEIFCRIGRNWQNGALFIGDLGIDGIDGIIAGLIQQRIGMSPKELHAKTCDIKKFDARSVTGDDYLAEKVVKLKFSIAIAIEECELVDDKIPDEAGEERKE